MSIAVIIPFYQRSEGLLARAIGSVLMQRDAGDVHIVVVDDTSPVSASQEIERLGPATRFPISVLVQPNAGPAAARNRGLDSLDEGIRRVAFIDSDDVWHEDHLMHAGRAMDMGFDFYFANLLHPGQEVGAFERAGRLDSSAHPRLDDALPLFAYRGDMFDQIISGNVIGTSTVVYDFHRFRAQRFDEAFYSAGEDYLFWISCAKAGARFCFSSEIEARYGFGVNVYSGSSWGTEGFLERVHNELRYRKRLLQYDLSPKQRDLVEEKIARLRCEFASDLIHRLTHDRSIPKEVVERQVRMDPRTLLTIPVQAGQLVAQRLKGRVAKP